MQYRNIEDQRGRQYVFHVSKSVVESAILIAQKGTLIAFRESKESPWKALDRKPVLRFKHVNIHKPLTVNVDFETWKDLVTTKVSTYEDLGFHNRPKAKVTVGLGVQCDVESLQETDNGVLYTVKEVHCKGRGCNKHIIGRQYFRSEKGPDGLLVNAVGCFVPNDVHAQRVRSRSKSWFCADCAVKYLKMPEPVQPDLPLPPAPAPEEPVVEPSALDTVIRDIEDLLSPMSYADAVFTRGAVWALTKLRPFLRTAQTP